MSIIERVRFHQLVTLLTLVTCAVWSSSTTAAAPSGQATRKPQVLSRLDGVTINSQLVKTWDQSFLTTEGSLEIAADVSSTRLILRNARIAGDLIVRGAPLEIDLSDAVLSGSLWIADWPSQKEERTFPTEDINKSKYPDEDREGCWRLPVKGGVASRINLERLQTRGIFIRYASAGALIARHAKVEDSIFLDHSSFQGLVDFSFSSAFHLEFTGATFHEGLGLQSMRINGNVDLSCSRIGGNLNALDMAAVGYTQMVGLTPLVHSAAPTLDFSFVNVNSLSFRGMSGHFQELNLSNADVNVLELDWEDPQREAHASLRKPWSFDRVLTRGAAIQTVRPSQRYRLETEDRVAAFAAVARRSDDRIYRKLAEAYARDGNDLASYDAWGRYSPVAFILHLPVRGAVGTLMAMLLLGTVVGRRRLRAFYGTQRQRPALDAFLLTFELTLPGIIDLGISKRHDAYLKQVSGIEEIAIVLYRLIGWILIAAVAAHLAISVGG